MASWTKNPPSGSNSRRKWDLEDRASLNNLKYHIAAEGCSEVQYDLARQLLEKSIEQNKESSSEQAVHWLCCAAQQGHDEASKLLRQCFEDGCGITSENESEVRCCLSMTPGERAARKAARELFACLSNGSEHITPRQLERKMREIYNLQKKRRNGSEYSTSNSEGEETENEGIHQPLEDAQAAVGNGHIHLHPQSQQHRHARRRVRRPRSHHQRSVHQNGQRADCIITEENLVSAAVNYAAGRMPAVSDALTLSIPHPASLDHVPCFHRLLFHPIIFFTLLYHRLINFIAALPSTVTPSMRLMALFSIYWLASSENLTIFLPIGFYYLCLGIMIWSTCKMLKTKHDFIDFRIWSGLFLSYGDHNIEADMSENRFLKNNMKPYLYFFGAFIGNLLVHPLIAVEWLPHSELTLLSFVFVFVSMMAFMYSSARRFPDWVVLISFGVNVLAKYPYEMDEVVTTGWRFLDLKVPTFCSFVIGNGIEFCLNCRTALYLLIPGFLVHLAKRSQWHGTYTHLIPHCVTLSWLQLCITSSQSATMFGLVRATLGLAGVLLFLPLFGLVSLLIPVFVAIEWLGFAEDPSLRLGTTVLVAILALLGSCFMAINRTTQKYVTVLQLLIGIIAACVLTFPYMTSNFKDSPRFGNILLNEKLTTIMHNNNPTVNQHVNNEMPPLTTESHHHHPHLSWQRFYALCGQPAWENQNKIKAQMRCSHLDGMTVAWEGTVSQVQISRVANMRADFIVKYLPHWLGNIIRCIYGERISEQLGCEPENDMICSDMQRIVKDSKLAGKCSLHKWNAYEYEIRARMSGGLLSKGSEVVLQAGHQFSNFTRRLGAGDRIHFYGTLFNSRVLPSSGEREDFLLGSSHAHVQLTAVECLACHDNIPAVSIERHISKSSVNARMRDLMRGIKYLLNVLLNPLITFK